VYVAETGGCKDKRSRGEHVEAQEEQLGDETSISGVTHM